MPRGKLLSLGCVALSASLARHAAAEAAPNRRMDTGYYVFNGGAVLTLFAAAGVSELLLDDADLCAGPDSCWFPGDRSVRQNHSRAARRLSQTTVSLTLAAPVFATIGEGVNARFANTELIYGEAVSANILLQTWVKFAFRRPRPYSYQLPPGAACETKDCAVSFYSGHASTAFTAAVAGSYLFAESAPNRGARDLMWGLEMTLASATANLRVRGGMHYYSDVLVGALVGTGLGVAIPVLHGERYRPDAQELAFAGGGLLVGTALSQLLPAGNDSDGAASWDLAPMAFHAGSGLQLYGLF
jgi:membrane-associated phospholipid phosphatase